MAFFHRFLDIQPQVQVTLACNSRCAYCFQRHTKGTIPIPVVTSILNKIVAACRAGLFPEKDSVTITWHGGEPFMAGLGFYEEIIRIESGFPDIAFHNRIQTNAVLMDRPFAECFKANHFQVGFSLDGPEDIHNRYRTMADGGTDTFSRTMKGIEVFRQATGQKRIPVIAVITRHSAGRADDLFDFFRGLNARVQLDICDIACRDFDSPSPSRVSGLIPSPEAVGQFLIRLFDLWFHDRSGRVDFPELREEVKMILQPEIDKGSPFHKRRCSLGRIIFAPDGFAYACDQFVNDPATALGHISRDSLKTILARRERQWNMIKAGVRRSAGHMACAGCEWGRRHAGGCMTCLKYNAMLLAARQKGLPDSRWTESALPPELKAVKGETYYCRGLRAFRAHVKRTLEREMDHA